MKSGKHTKTFLIWLAFFNWPPVLFWISKPLSFFPFLFWINIPALWLGLARAVGQPHYDIQEFGALPKTPLAWLLIFAFWASLSAAMTVATAFFPGLTYRNRIDRKDSANQEVDQSNRF